MKCGTAPEFPDCHDSSTLTGHGFYSLDVDSGILTSVFTLVNSDFDTVDACAISPVDSNAYCCVYVPANDGALGSKILLIRLDSNHTDPSVADVYDFVAVLPVPAHVNGGVGEVWFMPTSAAFAPGGDFHLLYSVSAGEFDGTLFVMTESNRPDQLTRYSDYGNSELADLTTVPATLTGFDATHHDVGVISADLDGDGSIEDWGVLVSSVSSGVGSTPNINVYRSPTSEDGFLAYTRGSTIEAGSPDIAAVVTGDWGAMWYYDGVLYASENSANGGAWQILVNTFNASNAVSLVTLRYAGQSPVTSSSPDGLNCMFVDSPWPTCGTAGNKTGDPVTDLLCWDARYNSGARYKPEASGQVCSSRPCNLVGVDFDRCCAAPTISSWDCETYAPPPPSSSSLSANPALVRTPFSSLTLTLLLFFSLATFSNQAQNSYTSVEGELFRYSL
jgi:hypothetical protein